MNLENLNRSKKPLYITVYDQLYKLIMEGNFPIDSKLPSEPELAKMLGVSRMTLRQALSLLQDDGLVKNVHGKGNFITRHHQNRQTEGLEKIGNPLYKCYTEPIDQVELIHRIDLASDYSVEVLKKKTAAVVTYERFYKNEQKIVAYALTMMAIETVSELNLDLQDHEQLQTFLEEKVYELANSSIMEIKRSSAVNQTLEQTELFHGGECDLILESVYISDQYPVMYNKFYIPKDFSRIKIKAVKS